MQRQPLADDPAQGQARKCARAVPPARRAAPVRPRPAGPGAPAARWRRHTGVVAQDAEVPGQCRELCIPHVQGGTDGVGERQQRFLRRTVQAIGEAGAILRRSGRRRRLPGRRSACTAPIRRCSPPLPGLERQLGLVLLERGGSIGLTAAGRSSSACPGPAHERAAGPRRAPGPGRGKASCAWYWATSARRTWPRARKASCAWYWATSARRAGPGAARRVLRQPAADPPAIAVRNRQRPAGAPAGRRGRPDPASRGQVRPTPGMARPVQGRAGPGHRTGPARRSSAATGAPEQLRPFAQCVMRDSARHSPPTDYFMLAGARQCRDAGPANEERGDPPGPRLGHLPDFLVDEELADGRLLALAGPHLPGRSEEVVAARRRDRAQGR